MRVTVIGKCPPLEGGVARRTFDFVRRIAQLGHDVSYFTNAEAASANFTAALDDADRLHFSTALQKVLYASLGRAERMLHIPISPAYETRLIGLAGEAVEQSDCVIGWYYQPYGVAAAVLARRFGKPCVLVHAGSDLGRLAHVRELQLAYRCLFSDARFIATGPASASLIADKLALGTREQVIPVQGSPIAPPYFLNGEPQAMDFGEWRETAAAHIAQWELDPSRKEMLLELNRKPLDPSAPTIGMYGKFGEQKGNGDLAQALGALAEKGRRFNFVSCGGGHPARIANFLGQIFEREALKARTWVFPFIAPWRVPRFIAACDVVAFLERDFPIYFHAPRVPREVMAVGTALLCSREISAKQPFHARLANRENYIDAGDPKDIARLAEAVDFCLSDRRRLNDIGLAGRALLAAQGESAPEDPIIPALQRERLL
jgi:glycosyltransferase involved in cell wall biosynthesis